LNFHETFTEDYLWTRKNLLTFGSHARLDYEDIWELETPTSPQCLFERSCLHYNGHTYLPRGLSKLLLELSITCKQVNNTTTFFNNLALAKVRALQVFLLLLLLLLLQYLLCSAVP